MKERKIRYDIMKNTIFIQIASYRDPQLLPTLKDCISKAKYPKNLRFGIAWQHHPDDDWDQLDEYINDSRFKILNIDYRDSQGVCWARNLIQSLYANEKYTLQLDSHHRFVENWDIILIDILQKLQDKGHHKPLITAYIPSFNPDNDPQERVQDPWKMTFDRYIPEGAVFFLPTTFDEEETKLNEPIPARFYSAHFAFTVGEFCREVRHDPYYYFHGEEINIAVRAFTHGYDLFYPHKLVCWHEYTRRGRSKQWDDINDWGKRNNECHLRNRKLFQMDNHVKDIDFGIYDFGKVRTLRDYEKYAGMHFGSRGVTKELIQHKIPKMDNIKISDEQFEQQLIHIFKHCIDIGYHQVPENDYDFWAVAFKDEDGNDMFRQDVDPNEIGHMKKDPDGYYKIWRSFETKIKPHSWIVWPHSISKGWAEPITGMI